ncbi:MAG: DUF423 domain-containing protein [Zymomonas mobilis]|uniref:DUF423 domain-containing protein n=1 Tax=Zymomonas mobilis TaxID=542 RepID=UPI0039EC6D7E
MKRDYISALAALSAAIAVAFGAAGAHLFHDQAALWAKTGADFQLIHAVAVLAIRIKMPNKLPSLLLLIGAFLFSSSLYSLALGAPKIVAHIAPIGGSLMIAGWLVTAVFFWLGQSRHMNKKDRP